MCNVNPLLTTDEEQFVVGDSDFAYFDDVTGRIDSGAILFCRRGSAYATVDNYTGIVRHDTLMFMLPGSIFQLSERSADFQAIYCAFSRELFAEAAFRLSPSFFKYLKDYPMRTPPEPVVEGAVVWFNMARYTYGDKENIFRNTIIKNRLQNVFLEMYDKTQRFAAQMQRPSEATTRQVALFRRFVAYVHENCAREREVSFYADKLCISTRYLSTIVRAIADTSAKEFIDTSVLPEIKMLLQTTDLSVQEIAYKMHFHDQSYLGRFFKRHTGESPSRYRNSVK